MSIKSQSKKQDNKNDLKTASNIGKTPEQEPLTLLKRKSALRENIEAVVIAIILALFIRTFVVQAFKIPSGSMEKTLLVGDHILVNMFFPVKGALTP